MLEIDVEIDGGLAKDVSAVVSALWTNTEVETEGDVVRVTLAPDQEFKGRIRVLELALHALEKAGAPKPLTVTTWDLDHPGNTPNTVRTGPFLIHRPDEEPPVLEPYHIPLILAPGQAFGSGKHPTTQLSLTALADFVPSDPPARFRPPPRFLDVGTGSGILALAASALTGQTVLAVDESSIAVDAARKNVRLNRLESKVRVNHQALFDLSGSYDFITANLVLPVLLEQGPHLVELLAPGGILVVSGFSVHDVRSVQKALMDPSIHQIQSYDHAFWSALVLTRGEG